MGGREPIRFLRFYFCCRISPRPILQQGPCRRTGALAVFKTDLSDVYRDYIACLNKQDWPKLEQFVHDEVYYNGQRIGLLGYREMLERDFYEISGPSIQHSAADFRSALYSEPARLRMYAKGKVPWPPCKREESFLY